MKRHMSEKDQKKPFKMMIYFIKILNIQRDMMNCLKINSKFFVDRNKQLVLKLVDSKETIYEIFLRITMSKFQLENF